MTLTYEHYIDTVKINHRAIYVKMYNFVRTPKVRLSSIDRHTQPTDCSTQPLEWL